MIKDIAKDESKVFLMLIFGLLFLFSNFLVVLKFICGEVIDGSS